MAHTQEEIRAASLEVLSGRIDCGFRMDQYAHLKIGVGKIFRMRENLPEPHGYAADNALSKEDANTFLEVFWDLFRDGVITLGHNDQNNEFPFFRVTSRGRRLLEGDNAYFLHDVSNFETQIRARIKRIDDVTLIYLKEAMNAFRAGCILSSSVMLGVAAEHAFQLLLDTIDANVSYKTDFAKAQKERTILQKINAFKQSIERLKKSLPAKLLEDFDTQFLAIQSLIRTFRNDSGHPRGQLIDREQAFVNLQLFVPFGRKLWELMDFFS